MRTPRPAAVAALLTLTAFLAGCGGDKNDDASADETTETVTATPSESASTGATETTPTVDTSESPMDPTASSDITQEQVDAALLTPEEVGADFVLGSYTDSDDPPPCDASGTPIDEAVPPAVQGGTEIDHSSGNAAMQEEISIYATESDAASAFTLGTSGLNCSNGTLPDGSTFSIDPPQDVTADVNGASGLGNSTAYGFSTDSSQGTLIVTLAGRVIMATTFQSTSDFDTSTLPNPVDVAAQAFAKALAN